MRKFRRINLASFGWRGTLQNCMDADLQGTIRMGMDVVNGVINVGE